MFLWSLLSLQILNIKVRNYTSLPALRFLDMCNVLSGPSLLMESTDSMIMMPTDMENHLEEKLKVHWQ